MYNLKMALNNATLTGEERNITQASFDTTRILLEANASNCMIPVCANIRSSIGVPFIMKNTTILNLFMMLETGCDLTAESDPPDGGIPMYCQFLLLIQQNSTDNYVQQRAANLYQSVRFDLYL